MTTATAINYKCPDWCTRTDHHADVVDADNPPMHYSPEFGMFWWQAAGDGPLEVASHDFTRYQLNGARALLKIARDATAAALWWLESQS